jgi:hypothetical protein
MYSIVPAGQKPLYFLYAVVAFLTIVVIAVGAALVKTVQGSQSATFELSGAGLRLRGDFYGREIPAAQLRGAGARVVNLQQESGLLPKSRRFGTGMPGYSAGWFRLANGEKALVYLTRRERVVYVPTTNDYSLLLSVDRPDEFVLQLRHVAPKS